jgi:hypothetical protein
MKEFAELIEGYDPKITARWYDKEFLEMLHKSIIDANYYIYDVASSIGWKVASLEYHIKLVRSRIKFEIDNMHPEALREAKIKITNPGLGKNKARAETVEMIDQLIASNGFAAPYMKRSGANYSNTMQNLIRLFSEKAFNPVKSGRCEQIKEVNNKKHSIMGDELLTHHKKNMYSNVASIFWAVK